MAVKAVTGTCGRVRIDIAAGAVLPHQQTLGVIFHDLLYHTAMQETESLLEFPCDFPIKAMGRSDSGFEAVALGIVRQHVPDFDTDNMRSAASRNGNYLSVTFTVRVSSRRQLDDLYRELTACKAVLMVL